MKKGKRIASFLLAAIVGFTMIPVNHVSAAETSSEVGSVAVNEKTFPDEVFRKYVLTNFDKNKDKLLSKSELESVRKIDCDRDTTGIEPIRSVKGVEYFTNLEYLNLNYHLIQELDVSKNTKLQTLAIMGNGLSKLDLSKNTKIKNWNDKYQAFTAFSNQCIWRNSIMGKIDSKKYTAILVSFPIGDLYDFKSLEYNEDKIFTSIRITALEGILKDSSKLKSCVWGLGAKTEEYVGEGRAFQEEGVYLPNTSFSKEENILNLSAYAMLVVEGDYTSSSNEAASLLKDFSVDDSDYFDLVAYDITTYDDAVAAGDIVPYKGTRHNFSEIADKIIVDCKLMQYYTIDCAQFVGKDDVNKIEAFHDVTLQQDFECKDGIAKLLPASYMMVDDQWMFLQDSMTITYYYDLGENAKNNIGKEYGYGSLGVVNYFNYVTETDECEKIPSDIKKLDQFKNVANLDEFEAAIIDKFEKDNGKSSAACEAITYDGNLWQYSSANDASWEKVNPEDFPVEGVEVEIPYPKGTDSTTEFNIAHVFTKDYPTTGYHAGDIEYPEVTTTEFGIKFIVHGFSPITVIYSDNVKASFDLNTTDKTAKLNGKKEVELAKNTKIGSLPTASRIGYVFKGWSTKKSGSTITKDTVIKKDTILYAQWLPITYNIKFDGNGATSGNMKNLTNIKYATSLNLTANSFKKSGMIFIGWNTKKDGSGKAYANKASVKNLTAKNNTTVTLYAQWGYKITYKLNGGKNNSKNPEYYVKGNEIKLQKPSKTGYTFKGWYSDEKLTKKVTEIKKGTTGNKTFYAKWAANKYTIKYNANGGTGSMKSLSDVTYNKNVTLSANSFKKSGMVFLGWNTKKDGSGKAYENKTSVKNLTSKNNATVTLYAQWGYKLSYNLNGGKNNPKNPSTYSKNSSTIKLFEPTRKGYKFMGWYSDKGLTKKVTEIKKGSTGNKTLYAKWKKQ